MKARLEPLKQQLEKFRILMLPHPVTKFEMQKYYQNKPKFNSVCSRNNLPKINDGAYVIHLDECKSIGTHWILSISMVIMAAHLTMQPTLIALQLNTFQNFKKFIGNKNIVTSIYRRQAYNSIMCGYFLLDLLILC